MAPTVSFAVVFKQALDVVRGQPQFQNQWIRKDVWLDIVKSIFPNESSLQTLGMKNIKKVYSDRLDLGVKEENHENFYGAKVGPDLYWYSSPCDPDKRHLPPGPGTDTFARTKVDSFDDIKIRCTRQLDLAIALEEANLKAASRAVSKNGRAAARKRSHLGSSITRSSRRQKVASSNHPPQDQSGEDLPLENEGEKLSSLIAKASTYWNSEKAWHNFRRINDEGAMDESHSRIVLYPDQKETVIARRKKLMAAYQTPEGWRDLIDDRDSSGKYTENDKHQLRWRAIYLAEALRIALDKASNTFGFIECCKLAIMSVNKREGVTILTDPEGLRSWHHDFRINDECFKNRHFSEKNGYKEPLPQLLEDFPLAKEMMVDYMKLNLNMLSSELVHGFVHEV